MVKERQEMSIKRKLTTAVLGLTSLVMATCGFNELCYNDRDYLNITSYEIIVDEYTPNGIGIDQSANPEHQLNLSEIDWQVDDLETCLTTNFLENPSISPEDAKPENGWCLKTEFPTGIEIK